MATYEVGDEVAAMDFVSSGDGGSSCHTSGRGYGSGEAAYVNISHDGGGFGYGAFTFGDPYGGGNGCGGNFYPTLEFLIIRLGTHDLFEWRST